MTIVTGAWFALAGAIAAIAPVRDAAVQAAAP